MSYAGYAGAGAVEGFQNSFSFIQDALRQKEQAEYLKQQRGIAEDQRKATAKVSKMMAEGAQTTAIPTDTQQSAQLAGQTDDADPDLDLTTEEDPAVEAYEEQLYASTGRTKSMVKDWQQFDQDFAQSLGAINDPELIAVLKDYPSAFRQRGFTDRLGRAAVLLEAKDMEGAADAVESAFSYMNDGTVTRAVATQDKDGNPVIMMNTVDEETGKPLGNAVAVNPKVLAGMTRRAKKGADDWDDQMSMRKDKRDEAREISYRLASTRPAGSGSGTPKWNSSNARGVSAGVQSAVEDYINFASDDMYDALEGNSAVLADMVHDVANEKGDTNYSGIINAAEPIMEDIAKARIEGGIEPRLSYSEDIGGYFVRYPNSGEPPITYEDYLRKRGGQ